jgi:hypothetical protein
MDFSSDELRRITRESEELNRDAMPCYDAALTRLIEDESSPDGALGDVVLGDFNRRNFLRIGGLTILGGAIMAVTGPELVAAAATRTATKTPTTAKPNTTMAPVVTKAPAKSTAKATMDVSILRTASSIEELAVAAYQIAIDSGLVKTAAIGDAAKYFQAQHREHSGLFQSLTKKAGGAAFTTANPALLKALDPQIKALKDEMGIVAFALSLEQIAASTYQSNVGMFTDTTLNKAIMTVGGVEARHRCARFGARPATGPEGVPDHHPVQSCPARACRPRWTIRSSAPAG